MSRKRAPAVTFATRLQAAAHLGLHVLGVLALLMILGSASVASDRSRGLFKPVVAKQKLIYVSEDVRGVSRTLYEFTGVYLRSSDGSELATLGLSANGTEGKPTEGRLRLAKEGVTYKLDYVKHTATAVATQRTPLAPHGEDRVNKEDVVGRENMNGEHCVVATVHDNGDEVGTAWRSIKSDILVRLESYFGSKADHVRVILDRYDISTRQEPDPSLFVLTGQWTIIAPASVSPAAEVPVAPKPEPLPR